MQAQSQQDAPLERQAGSGQVSLGQSVMALCFVAAIAILWEQPWGGSEAQPDPSLAAGSTDVSEVSTDISTDISTELSTEHQPLVAGWDTHDWVTVPEPAAEFEPPSTTPPVVGISSPHVIVDLSDRQVYLFRLGRIEAAYPVAVGQAGWETPTGMYRVIQLDHDPIWRHPITKVIVPPGDNNPLGSRWIGFWTDGEYQFGIHGTNQPELIGQAVSHGCLRMHNADIETLFEQIYLGTPLIVRP